MEEKSRSTQLLLDEKARSVFGNQKVALFIVAYNAEKHIEKTFQRIPSWCRSLFTEIYLIDDSSRDHTIAQALATARDLNLTNFTVMKTPNNQGYGGNQKIGYAYAAEKGYDIVILLHGDGQYPPEQLPAIVAQYSEPGVDAVFGSRMMIRSDALRGGMPMYKWLGNQVLTGIENFILGTSFTEFHSGYRSYRVEALRNIPFRLNSNGFHFDTDIIIQLVLRGCRIKEIPMPTHYGDEECHVNGFPYAWNCFKSALKSRLHQAGLFFQPNFEVVPRIERRTYTVKEAPTSLHAYINRRPWQVGETVLDLGANDGILAQRIAAKGPRVTAIDIHLPDNLDGVTGFQLDLNDPFEEKLGNAKFDTVLALDVIEHLNSPESGAQAIHHLLRTDGILYASTANIGYIVMRLTHLIGWFNYGKKGILDRTHHRLFTLKSFRRLLENAGFTVVATKGFGPPLVDAFGSSPVWEQLDRWCFRLAQWWPSLFAFNFLLVATKNASVEEKLLMTRKSALSIQDRETSN